VRIEARDRGSDGVNARPRSPAHLTPNAASRARSRNAARRHLVALGRPRLLRGRSGRLGIVPRRRRAQ